MTIKEVEARTGLTRANIRYYEGEGFFSAARGENGYRDYTGENVDVLLKIKLFRQLGFSLEDIRDLQRGDQALETALARREEGLDREQAELGRAALLCRELREEGADFATLDARRYLDRLEQEKHPAALKEDRFPEHDFFWRRLFARFTQWLFWNTLATACLILGERMGLSWTWPRGETACGIALAAMLVTETLSLHRTGTTPIKSLFGLKIIREDGSFFSLVESFRRTLWAVVVMAAFFYLQIWRAAGNYVAGMCNIAMLYLIWSSDSKKYFWAIENEVYLEGSTRETDYWQREGSTRKMVIILILDTFAVWFWFVSIWL